MERDPLEYDPLREEFDRLEREVRQRECKHDGWEAEVTALGDAIRRFICSRCGADLSRLLKRDPA